MLTLLGWGALKHVWNMQCFVQHPGPNLAKSSPSHFEDTPQTSMAANKLIVATENYLFDFHIIAKFFHYFEPCDVVVSNFRRCAPRASGARVREAEARTASSTSQSSLHVSEKLLTATTTPKQNTISACSEAVLNALRVAISTPQAHFHTPHLSCFTSVVAFLSHLFVHLAFSVP